MRSTNWERIAAELAEDISAGGGRMRRASLIFQQRLKTMSREEIIAAFDEVSALGLHPESWVTLKFYLLGSLIERDPGYVVTHFSHDLLQDKHGTSAIIFNAFEKWADKDVTHAAAWLDEQIASGSLDGRQLKDVGWIRLQFEGLLIGALISSSPAEAHTRLSSIPLNQRLDALQYVGRVPSENQLALANLIRSHLNLEGQIRSLSSQLANSRSNDGYSEASDFLDRIESPQAERDGIVGDIVQGNFERLSSRRKVTIEDVDEMRGWIASQSPSLVDSLTGFVLANNLESIFKLTFEEAAL